MLVNLGQTTGEKQSAATFLLFRRVTQLSLYHNANLAVTVFNTVVARLGIAIDRHPDTEAIGRLGEGLAGYLSEVSKIIAVDRGLIVSNAVDRGLPFIRSFLARELMLDSEFYEAKFRRSVHLINACVANVLKIREQAGAILWNSDIEELETLMAAIESASAALVDPDAADQFPFKKFKLSNSLLSFSSLLPLLSEVPPSITRELETAGFAIAASPDPAAIGETLETIARQIALLREAKATLKPAGDPIETDADSQPAFRKEAFGALARLTAELERFSEPVDNRGGAVLAALPARPDRVHRQPGGTAAAGGADGKVGPPVSLAKRSPVGRATAP
jgi:hypothetical protein